MPGLSYSTWDLRCGMWDLPRPGLEPVSPALAGRFLTTAPPGKPHVTLLNAVPRATVYVINHCPHLN